MTEKTCPKCGAPMHIMYGCGWDYDKMICSERWCDYEIELETISFPEVEEEETK